MPNSEQIDTDAKRRSQQVYNSLNPFKLNRKIRQKPKAVFTTLRLPLTRGIAKARVLAAMLGPELQSQLGLDLPPDVLENLCHYLVESGVDFLVRDLDPSIGNKLIAAADNRSNEVPALLANAYAADFSALAGSRENAVQIILTAEGNFRASIMGYGWALAQQDKDKALDLVADGLAKIGVSYLGLPDGSETALAPVARQGIVSAMTLCAPDFEAELKATTGWVNGRLSSHGIAW